MAYGLRAYRTPKLLVARGFVVKKRLEVGLRIACLAWLGTLAHMMRTRRLHARLCARLGKAFGARLGKAFGARPHPATKKSARQLAARQRVLFCEKMNIDP